MGLTGVVVDATIELVRIDTSYMLVDTERASDIDDCMAKMTEHDTDTGTRWPGWTALPTVPS